MITIVNCLHLSNGIGYTTQMFAKAWAELLTRCGVTVQLVCPDLDQSPKGKVSVKRPPGWSQWIVMHILHRWDRYEAHPLQIDPCDKVLYFQMEQMGRPEWFPTATEQYFKEIQTLSKKYFYWIDFARSNISILRPLFSGLQFDRFVAIDPPCTFYDLAKISTTRRIQVGFCGHLNDRRNGIFQSVNQALAPLGITVETKYGWFTECQDKLLQTRIMLNVHFHDVEFKALETVRIADAVSAGCFVISEETHPQDKRSWLAQCAAISFVPTNASFAEHVASIVSNIDTLYGAQTQQDTVRAFQAVSVQHCNKFLQFIGD